MPTWSNTRPRLPLPACSMNVTSATIARLSPSARTARGDEFVAPGTSVAVTAEGRRKVGAIRVHEFMSLDGVIDAPTWTFDYGYDPKMGEAIAASMDGCTGILLGRTTYEMFEPAWVAADRRRRSRSAILQRDHEVRRLGDADDCDVEELADPRAIRCRGDPPPEERRRRPLGERQRHARPRAARRRPRRPAAPVRLSAYPRKRA